MQTLCIIQARMGSSRLPKKVLMDIAGKPLIHHVIDRTLKSKLIDKIVVATTTSPADDKLVDALSAYSDKVCVFRGSENDVLDRYYQSATRENADIIVRITGDCPLIDPEVADMVIKYFIDSGKFDYVSNIHPPTYPDGLDTEVFSYKALKKAWEEARLQSEREHVTPYIHKNPNIFKLGNIKNDKDFSHMRWTVDTKEDLEFARKIFGISGNQYLNMSDIINLINEHHDISKINSMYERNEGYAKSIKEDKSVASLPVGRQGERPIL